MGKDLKISPVAVLVIVLLISPCVARTGQVDETPDHFGNTATMTKVILCRERIALRSGSAIKGGLEDSSLSGSPAIILAKQSIRPEGQWVNPFARHENPNLINADHRYAVHTQIREPSNQMLMTTTSPHDALIRGNPQSVELILYCVSSTTSKEMEAVPVPQTHVYQCEEFEFSASMRPGEVVLYLPNRTVVLGQVRAASGVKYQSRDILFWTKGDNAVLQLGGRQYRHCKRNQ